MALLTRWQDDTSRPTAKEAGRDLAIRAVAPIVGVVAAGARHGLAAHRRAAQGARHVRGERQQEPGVVAHLALATRSRWSSRGRARRSASSACACVVVGMVWWRTKQWWFAVVPLIAISLQAMVFFFTTLLIDRERPDVEKLDDSPPTSSFPSGHTGAATGLYFTLALMALRIPHPVLRAGRGRRVRGGPAARRDARGSTAACTTSATCVVAIVNGSSPRCSRGAGCVAPTTRRRGRISAHAA